MQVTNKKSEKQLALEKSELINNTIAWRCAYYRENPQRFARDYLNLSLKRFQEIILYEMFHNNYTLYVAARGQGKTFLASIFICIYCILYPKTKVCIAAKTRPQANEVLSKIEDDLMVNYTWGSKNLSNEIKYHTVGTNKAVVEFKNGSIVQVVTAGETGRGKRANIIVVDEFFLLDKEIIDQVVRRYLTAPRQPGYLRNPKYRNLTERNKEIYIGSAWLKEHWSYEKYQSYMANMLDDTKKYFTCDLPYQISIKEGLLSREQLQDEMSEADFDEMKFATEMEGIFWGSDDGAFFKFDDINKCRRLKNPVYADNAKITDRKSAGVPDLLPNERRILSVDIALMASTKHNNDASSIIINSAIPKNNAFQANIIYLENVEGANTTDLAMRVRKLFDYFKCTDLVIDTNGVGLGVADILVQDMVDNETGQLYPALTFCNDKAMAERCKVPKAKAVMWSVKANAKFNSDSALALRSGFQKRKINLLVTEYDADEILKDKVRDFTKKTAYEQQQYKMPYIQTTLLVYELVSLQYEMNGADVKIKEKSGMRKDRYSSLSYNYWVMMELERENLRTKRHEFSPEKFVAAMGRLNHRPKMY